MGLPVDVELIVGGATAIQWVAASMPEDKPPRFKAAQRLQQAILGDAGPAVQALPISGLPAFQEMAERDLGPILLEAKGAAKDIQQHADLAQIEILHLRIEKQVGGLGKLGPAIARKGLASSGGVRVLISHR